MVLGNHILKKNNFTSLVELYLVKFGPLEKFEMLAEKVPEDSVNYTFGPCDKPLKPNGSKSIIKPNPKPPPFIPLAQICFQPNLQSPATKTLIRLIKICPSLFGQIQSQTNTPPFLPQLVLSRKQTTLLPPP